MKNLKDTKLNATVEDPIDVAIEAIDQAADMLAGVAKMSLLHRKHGRSGASFPKLDTRSEEQIIASLPEDKREQMIEAVRLLKEAMRSFTQMTQAIVHIIERPKDHPIDHEGNLDESSGIIDRLTIAFLLEIEAGYHEAPISNTGGSPSSASVH